MTGAAMVGARALNSGGVGCPVSSLKVAPRLLETGMSVTSTEVDWVGVKPMTKGVKCRPYFVPGEANHWETCSVGEANWGVGYPWLWSPLGCTAGVTGVVVSLVIGWPICSEYCWWAPPLCRPAHLSSASLTVDSLMSSRSFLSIIP
jgi:hypothetical protein